MSLISKLTCAGALALSLTPAASHAAQLRSYPKIPTPRFVPYEDAAIKKAAKVAIEDTLKYIVEETSNVCGTTGEAGANVKVVIRAPNGKLVLLRTYGVPNDGAFTSPSAIECK